MSGQRNQFMLRPIEQSSNALRNCSSSGLVDVTDDMHSDTCVGRMAKDHRYRENEEISKEEYENIIDCARNTMEQRKKRRGTML